jgi:hypothetical protein
MKYHSTDFSTDFPDSIIQIIGSKEYGASKLLLSIARQLKLDQAIFSRKVQWREDILALVVGKLLFPLNEVSLANFYNNTILWECCGHPPNKKPEIKKHCEEPLAQLLSRQEDIQKKLANKHLKNRCAILYALPFWKSSFERKDLYAGLLANEDGYPFAIEFFPNSEDKIQSQIKALGDKYKLNLLILISDFKIITDKEKNFINLTCSQVYDLVHKNRGYELATSRQLTLINQQLTYIEKTFREIFVEEPCFYENKSSLSSLLLTMLSFYIKWHMSKKLESYFKKNNSKAWTFLTVLERLKSIRSQTVQVGKIIVTNVKSELDQEQSEILSIFDLNSKKFFF